MANQPPRSSIRKRQFRSDLKGLGSFTRKRKPPELSIMKAQSRPVPKPKPRKPVLAPFPAKSLKRLFK